MVSRVSRDETMMRAATCRSTVSTTPDGKANTCKYSWERDAEKKLIVRTINDPVTLPLAVLTQRNKLQVLLTMRIASGWTRFGSLCLLMLVVDDAPCTVDNPFDLHAMTEL
jgi:hypothetical protein